MSDDFKPGDQVMFLDHETDGWVHATYISESGVNLESSFVKRSDGGESLIPTVRLLPCVDMSETTDEKEPRVIIPKHAEGNGQKQTNPKDALAGAKPRWFSYLPLRVLVGIGVAMYEGARKYGRHNYRPAGVRASVYVDAVVCGHLTAWWEGQDIDPDSGRSHIDKAIASLMVLRDSMYEGNWEDDRPPRAANYDEIIEEAAAAWRLLQEKHPDPEEPWTQKRIEQEQ